MKYDIIVIGSGFGGLICARQLALAGRSVLVLERESQPGGCLQCYRRGSMTFDTGFHYVGGLAEGQALHEVFDTLGLMHLPWHRLSADGFDRVTIGGETFAHAEGFDGFAATLAASFPSERDALQKYVRLLENLPPMEQSGGISAFGYLSSLFRDPLLIDVLAATSMKMELRRESLPLFTFAHVNSSYIQSSWRLQGGGARIVESLVDDIRQAGGELFCQREVDELIEREGRIVAARCQTGEVFEADTFVSNVHPALTLNWIRESTRIKPLMRRRIAALENTGGMFTASLVLKPATLPYFNHNKYIFRRANVWDEARPEAAPGGVDRVMVGCQVPQEGNFTQQVDLITPLPWEKCQSWQETSIGKRGEDYRQMKRELAHACIELAETELPGLGKMVQQIYTSTPLTWRDYTLSPQGSAFGIRKDCRQLLMTMLSPRTPISNLLLTGQSLMVHGLEGVAMTALQTTREVLASNHG